MLSLQKCDNAYKLPIAILNPVAMVLNLVSKENVIANLKRDPCMYMVKQLLSW